jgi:hypothetical protein
MLLSDLFEILCPVTVEPELLFSKRVESLHDTLNASLEPLFECTVVLIPSLDNELMMLSVSNLYFLTNLCLCRICWRLWVLGIDWHWLHWYFLNCNMLIISNDYVLDPCNVQTEKRNRSRRYLLQVLATFSCFSLICPVSMIKLLRI